MRNGFLCSIISLLLFLLFSRLVILALVANWVRHLAADDLTPGRLYLAEKSELCDTGTVQRQRNEGIVEITDPDTERKRGQLSRLIR